MGTTQKIIRRGRLVETWQLSRAGIVNFWYYDDEEFIAEDGRLLLRGANGSGKSVTMQSLVPVLFDGNKSPERLDPFGSKARKMESYLLSEGLDLEERTAYLYLEFEKPLAHRYLTIGMGMRARKNKPMQSWYFIIHDNRRLGKDRDLCLYKNVGNSVPLTQKELENKIGDGGHLYTKQSDYKKGVNDYLYGYEDITDFDELITLLIQIRSPKLSKEFKPTTIYEIMRNSLITLTEEDLRPMSEAIENMDEVKDKMDGLRSSEQAMKRIDQAYSKYNTYMLVNKAKRYINTIKLLEKDQRDKQKQENLYEENVKSIENLSQQLSEFEEEEDQLKKKELRLKEHDLSKLASEKIELESKLETIKVDLDKKLGQVNKVEDSEINRHYKAKEKKEELEKIEDALIKQLVEMGQDADDAGFDEHDFFNVEYKKSIDTSYNFSYHNHAVDKYIDKLNQGNKQLSTVENLEKDYDKEMQKREEKLKEESNQEQRIREHEGQLQEVRSEFAEAILLWAQSLKVLTIEEKSLNKAVELVYQYGEIHRFDEVIDSVLQSYNSFREEVLKNRSFITAQRQGVEKKIEEAEESLSLLLAQREPEPERTQAVESNRRRLLDANIPFVPLYKALEFHKEIDEDIRNALEEAFFDLGILDALIVAPSYKEQVLAMDVGMADKYIFSKPQLLSHNLTTFLKAEKSDETIATSIIDDVLQSIFVNSSEEGFFMDEKGHYGLGIIRGKVSGTYESRFIGYQSRKRYKEELIANKKEEIRALEETQETLISQIESLSKDLEEAENEWRIFPKEDNLKVAYTDYVHEKDKLRIIVDQLTELAESVEKLFQSLKSERILLHEVTKGLTLQLSSDTFGEAINIMEGYKKLYYEFKGLDKDKWHIVASLGQIEEEIERIEEQLDDLRSDCHRLEGDLKSHYGRISHIKAELSLKDYKEIFQELDACQKRLKDLPTLIKNTMQDHSNKIAENNSLEQVLTDLGAKLVNQSQRVDLYRWAFDQEIALGYVQLKDEERQLIDLAKELVTLHGAVLEMKETALELQGKVNEKFHKESGELADYHLKSRRLFKEKPFEIVSEEDCNIIERFDISSRVQGKESSFYEMLNWMHEQMMQYSQVIEQQDRELFEEILINSVSRKISAKIFHSEQWVRKIDQLMSEMDTSMGLKFNLRWVTKNATSENQLSTKELVAILKGEQSLLTREKKEALINHFRSKIQETRSRLDDVTNTKPFLTIMKEVLDYRQWFEFQLSYTRPSERKKEMTDSAFFTFSGGEKAMAMYVPLFSAVYAKYQGAKLKDCPKLVSLDEAFAGVDEKNIKDMFKLLVELDLGFIANSQVLFGDYETVPALGIYELIRPENVQFVTLIRYLWNGESRRLVTEGVALE